MDWKSRRVETIVEQALAEDKATADATTLLTIDPALRGTGTVMAKQDCVVAGLGVIPRVLTVFARLEGRSDASFQVVSHPEIFDGVRVRKGQSLAVIRTSARTLLSTERVILNLLQRMSGIATLTRRYADAVQGTGTTGIDTRKTVPGLRILDKYAVTCGGGENHRLDLSDGILIKNNHIALGGGVARVLANAHAGLADSHRGFGRHGACDHPRLCACRAGLHFGRRAHALRRRGGPEHAHHGGARLSALADTYDLPALDESLAGTLFAGHIYHFNEIASTNTHAMAAGTDGAPHGSVYLADAQTGGRGRGAHGWLSPAGSGIYVSVLLRPRLSPGDALWLSLAAGVAAQKAIEAVTGFRADLRWPNDLLAGPRKLGGILTEMQAEVTRVRFVVIGIGINVHGQFPPELAATSLAQQLPGSPISRQPVLVNLLIALAREAEALASPEAPAMRLTLLRELEVRSTWVRGKRVTVGEEAPFSGITEGLDERGFLRVRTASGELRTVLSGGVREARE